MRATRIFRLMVLAAALSLVGCSSNNKGKIEGTKWAIEATTLKRTNVPAGAIRFDFNKDHTLNFIIGPNTYTGKYSLGFGDRVTLNMDKEMPDVKTKTLSEKITINGDNMTMVDPDGTTTHYTKIK